MRRGSILHTPVLGGRSQAVEPDTEEKTRQCAGQDVVKDPVSPPHPIHRLRDMPTIHKPKRHKRSCPLSKLALELYQESTLKGEFFRCYLEDDIVDIPELRGKVHSNTGDDDQESGEELVQEVTPQLMEMLERAILAAL